MNTILKNIIRNFLSSREGGIHFVHVGPNWCSCEAADSFII